jgi:hypothetical protein
MCVRACQNTFEKSYQDQSKKVFIFANTTGHGYWIRSRIAMRIRIHNAMRIRIYLLLSQFNADQCRLGSGTHNIL